MDRVSLFRFLCSVITEHLESAITIYVKQTLQNSIATLTWATPFDQTHLEIIPPEEPHLEQTPLEQAPLEATHLKKAQLEQAHFIEEVGLMFEFVGLPRMAGRIFGWLLISEPVQQSSSHLAEILQASKGSISTTTRLLIQIGLIERVGLPGDRRDYFQIKPHAWSQMSEQHISQISAFRKLAERGLDLLKNTPPPLQKRLQEMRDIHAFLERELPLLHQRWEAAEIALQQGQKAQNSKL